MPIISISVTKELLKEMNHLEKSEGFSGRSDLIRAGIRELINLKQERTSLTGELQSILIITQENKDVKYNYYLKYCDIYV